METGWLSSLDYAGVAVFAATGALAASRKQLDITGFAFLASFTGIGGGTLRDLVLRQNRLEKVLGGLNFVPFLSKIKTRGSHPMARIFNKKTFQNSSPSHLLQISNQALMWF